MKQWVLILGCSTGHGGATARKLAEDGYGIIGFHFDRGDIKKEAEAFCEELKGLNDSRAHFFNKNAAENIILSCCVCIPFKKSSVKFCSNLGRKPSAEPT